MSGFSEEYIQEKLTKVDLVDLLSYYFFIIYCNQRGGALLSGKYIT